ncbi:hypothetical protein HDA40_000761 [Hamadaea flava]|nr:hypothetical protein [Hamadaea flava]
MAVPSSQREVIHTENPRNLLLANGRTQQRPYGGVTGQGHRQRRQKPGGAAPGQFPRDRADLGRQAGRASLAVLQDAGDLLAEGLAAAVGRADPSAYPHHDLNPARVTGTSRSVRS